MEERKTLSVRVLGETLTLRTRPGLFSPEHVDRGTLAMLSRAELRAALQRSLGDCAGLRKVLLLPPDFTRFHSAAGTLTQLLCELLPADCQVDVMPALGTHTPVTRAQWERMFAGIPYEKMIVHNWRTDTKKLGCVPAEVVARLSEGTMAEPIDVELNARVMELRSGAVHRPGGSPRGGGHGQPQ